jgi:hypothetical protein
MSIVPNAGGQSRSATHRQRRASKGSDEGGVVSFVFAFDCATDGQGKQSERLLDYGGHMKLLCAVLISLLGTYAYAQSPDVSLNIKTSHEPPVIAITNAHIFPIEALLVTVDVSHNAARPWRIYYDSHINYKHDLPIAVGGSQELPLPHMADGPQPTATLRAVVFSDGSTLGDRSWVDELLGRRTVMIERLNEVLNLLDKISEQNLTKEQAITVLQQAREARIRASANESPEEQALQGLVFYGAISSLDPPSAVAGKPHDVRTMIKYISRVYRDWLANVQCGKPLLSNSAANAATN